MAIALAIIIGLAIGSFLNVCIYRIPDGKSVITPRSHCPHCKHPIPWYDNIPVLSFILLGGKCRFCKEKISIRYIIVEALTASLFGLFIGVLGLHIATVIFLLLCCGMVIATFVDFERQEIPDEITYGGIMLGLIVSLIYPQLHGVSSRFKGVLASFIGLLAGGVLIYLTGILGKLIFKKDAMGGGDVKFLAMIGTFLGYKNIIFIYLLAPFFGSFVGIIMKFKYKIDIIPYGPYLSLATVVVILWGERILNTLFPYL